MISFIFDAVKSYFTYLNRLWKGDYRPLSIASFGITSLVVVDDDYICGLADEAVIGDDLYFLLIDLADPQEAIIMRHAEKNGEKGLFEIRNNDELNHAWEYFTNPSRKKSEIMQNLIYFWEHGEVGTRNEMPVIKYILYSFSLSASLLFWLYVLNFSNIQVIPGDIVLSTLNSEILFFGISILIMLTATLLTIKNNRRVSTVWSNTFIAVGTALATKLTGIYSGVAAVMLAAWILLTVFCSINIYQSINKTSLTENARITARRKKCAFHLSRNILTTASLILSALFFITVL